MLEDCAVCGTELEKIKSLSKKLVFPHRMATAIDMYTQELLFIKSHSKLTWLAGTD